MMRDRAEAAEAALAETRRALEALRARAEREPLAVDISDYSDEWCAGFLQGQTNALDEATRALAAAGGGTGQEQQP